MVPARMSDPILIRPFRNDDPPKLAKVWNASCAGRGSYPIEHGSVWDRWVMSKPYFSPSDLLVAERAGEVVGFVLSGFGCAMNGAKLDHAHGVVCLLVVRPDHRRQGLGRQLFQAAEQNLMSRGARRVVAGSQRPHNPYGLGIYGGVDSPGVLESDTSAHGFLKGLGWERVRSVKVFRRDLTGPFSVIDNRFAGMHRRYEVRMYPTATLTSWWQEASFGLADPTEFRLEDKKTHQPVARALAWEIDGFSRRWKATAAGWLEMTVTPEYRRQGMGKFLGAIVLRFLQEQFFGLVEAQIPADDPAGDGLLRSLGFQAIDAGWIYARPEARDAASTAEFEIVPPPEAE